MDRSVYGVVLNWNNYKDTVECIESLRNSTHRIAKIVLVDNGSQDGSIDLLWRDFADNGDVHIIRNDRNRGFADGVNIGVRYALAEGAGFVFLLNNDAVVDPDCISRLLAAMDGAPDVGLAGPRIFYYREPTRIWQGSLYFSWLKTGITDTEKNKCAHGCVNHPREVFCVTGCAVLIRREVLHKIGLFDPDYFFYGEDIAFCLGARRAGFRILYVPAAMAWHKIEDIAKDRSSPFVMYHLARSRLLLLRRNFALPYVLYGVVMHLVVYTPYRMLQIMRGSKSLRAALSWIGGTWDGIVGGIRLEERR